MKLFGIIFAIPVSEVIGISLRGLSGGHLGINRSKCSFCRGHNRKQKSNKGKRINLNKREVKQYFFSRQLDY